MKINYTSRLPWERLFVAYASNSSGTNVSLTPSTELSFKAEIYVNDVNRDITIADFKHAKWRRYKDDEEAHVVDYESVVVKLPGVLTSASTSALRDIAAFPMIWNTNDAKLVEVKCEAVTAVSGGDEPTIDVLLNGVSALIAPISVGERISVGTIDTAHDTIVSGQALELALDEGNGDSENIVTYLKFKLLAAE